MKKPKKSTKVLYIAISVFIVLGISLATIGFLSGISNWYVLDGNSIKTSNMFEQSEENRELEAFTSIEMECPFQVVNIAQGDKFSVKYISHQYSVTPEVSVSNGVLKIGNKFDNEKTTINWQVITSYDKHYADNTITITIPKGVVLENVKIDSQKNLPVDRNHTSQGASVNISDVEIKNLNIYEEKSTNYNLSKVITNCVIGKMSIIFSRDASHTEPAQYIIKNSEINELATNHVIESAYGELFISVDDSKVFSVTGEFDGFESDGSELANVKINATDIKIVSSILTGENDLKATGNISVNSVQQSNDLNCYISRAVTEDNALTEIVSYDDPRYAYGYLTNDTKAMGTRVFAISQEEHDIIDNKFHQYEQNDHYYPTELKGDDEKSKYDDYIKLESEYDYDSQESTYKLAVYEKKAITYTVNEDGYVSYFDLRGKMGSENYLCIGTDKSLSELKKSKLSKSKNSLKCYSQNGYVVVDFAG